MSLGARLKTFHPASVLAWMLAWGIFGIDLLLPVGYAVPLLYVPLLILTLRSTRPGGTYGVAALATVLTVAEFVFYHEVGDLQAGAFNRALAIVAVWVTAVGITLHQRSEVRERESRRQLDDVRFALDQSAIVASTDAQGRITYVNDQFCAISRYSREELLGQDHRIINSGLHPPEFFRGLWQTISSGRIWRGEIRNRAKDGSFYWVDTTIVPFLDAEGRPERYTDIRHDITERKASDAALRQQQSLAQLGRMAAVVAHEVRNPLAAMRGALQILQGRLTDTTPATIIKEIINRIDALTAIVQDLLQFARPTPPRLAAVALDDLVRETVTLLENDPQFARVTVTVEPCACTATIDLNQMKVVLTNLLINSAQAMKGQGAIHISTRHDEEAHELQIRDTGPGMSEEAAAHLFEPFFTTKHQGTGLGLATARRVLEGHGGTLTFQSPAGGGTIAIVRLPGPGPQ
jgi:PAS domain S-box-containing protein